MPVIAPVELHDEVAPRRRARHAHGAHHGLRPARDEAHALGRRVEGAHELGELHLRRRGRPERGPARRGLRDRGDDLRVRVPERERPPGEAVVDQAISVLVLHDRALARAEKERRSAHVAEGAHGARDAARERLLRAREERLRSFGAERHARSSSSQRAASAARAWYVTIRSAPARRMAIQFSRTIARRSATPARAASSAMAYSPLTL